MSKFKNILNVLKSKGISSVIKIIYRKLIQWIDGIIIELLWTFNIKKKYIVLESEGDYTDNVRAFSDYLVQKNLNQEYRLIWFVHNPQKFQTRRNITFISRFHNGIHFKADYYIAVSKFFVFSHPSWLKKWRKDQVVINTTHSVDQLKAHVSKYSQKTADYVLCCSDFIAEKRQVYYPDSEMLVLGLPRIDLLFRHKDCVAQIFNSKKNDKLVLVMETFKQSTSSWIDGETPNKFGLNIIENAEQLIQLDQFLDNKGYKMIIKIHHLQDMTFLEGSNYHFYNIKYLTDDQLASYNIQVNELVENADFLITDYSSVFYEFLLLNRPIGFSIGDINSYTRGFITEDIFSEMPGEKIRSFDDLISFLSLSMAGKDNFEEERKAMVKTHFKYPDDKNCERLLEWMKAF